MTKPRTAAGYSPEMTRLVRATCLYVATKLGDFMDEVVVVGGMVPSLLIDQTALPPGVEAHTGTMDLDMGLSFGLVSEARYHAVADRVRAAGFKPAVEDGKLIRQRWMHPDAGGVTIDFLIEPATEGTKGGTLQNLESDLAAINTPGLHLAFQDRRVITIDDVTIHGERASRSVNVCGPGAYVTLKALAFRNRGENKDAYDLYYLLRSLDGGVGATAAALHPHLADPDAQRAIEILRADFTQHDGLGPLRTAEFLGGHNDELQADVVGFVLQLLELIGQGEGK